MNHMSKVVLLTMTLLPAVGCAAAELSVPESCWEASATAYGLPAELLKAIGWVESAHDPSAQNCGARGRCDYGVMQIRYSWLKYLEPEGIGVPQLMDPCINVAVGAWILAEEVQRYGRTWEAVGAYHAGAWSSKAETRAKQKEFYENYIRKVFAAYTRFIGP